MGLAEQAELIVKLSLRDQLSRGIKTANQNLKTLGVNTGKIGRQISSGMGSAVRNIERIGLVAGAAAVGGIVAATNAAIDFEDAFAGVVKTVDEADLAAAGLTFEDLSDQFRAMAREIPIAAVELAGIGEAAGALGIRAADIEEFTRTVALLSVTTNLTSEAASTALGHLGTILHLTGDDFEDFADTLVALGNSGASTEDQIVEMAARFAAAGNAAGLSKEDILALSSAVASMGIEVEAGGSALSRVFNNVATNIGTDSAKAKEFAKALGLSAGEFKEAWDRDALGTLTQFLGKLNELDQFEAAALLKKVGITNTRDVSTVRLMAQNIEFVNDALETSRTSTGALGEEAGKKFATTRSQLQLLRNTLIDIGITVGNEVLPTIVDLAEEFREVVGKPENQQKIKDFARDLGQGIRDLVGAMKNVDWGSIGSSLQTAAGAGKALIDAFLGAPAWLKTAVITGWGLNKLTGGAVGGIASELAKGLVKGILGINAQTVIVKAATVSGVGAGGAGGAVKGGMGIGGSLVAAAGGAIVVALIADQFMKLEALTAAASGAVFEKIAQIPDKTYNDALAAVGTLNTTIGEQGKDFIKGLLMATGTGRKENLAAFEELVGNLNRTAQTPEERAAAAAALDTLARSIAENFSATGDQVDSTLVELQGIASILTKPPPNTPVVPGPGFTEWMHQQATGDANTAQSIADLKAAFADEWGALGGQLRDQGEEGNRLRRDVAKGLGITVDELVNLRHAAVAEVARQTGFTVDQIRQFRRQADGNDEIMAAKLGISVEELRIIRDKARTTAVQTTKIAGKDFSPTVKVTVNTSTRVGITGRQIYDSNRRQIIVNRSGVE